MHRIDNTKFLLFIEPKKTEKATVPINDDLTKMMEWAIKKAKTGIANYSHAGEEPNFKEGNAWRGMHITDCGQMSGNKEYLLENGMVTNSLAVFYLQYYRNSIPESEMDKVRELAKFYSNGFIVR